MSKCVKPVANRNCVAIPAFFAATTMAVLGAITAPAPAHATFRDVCYDEVVVQGQWARSYQSAIKSAQKAWGPAAAKRYGHRFADYSYSGERQFTCIWNDAGTRYRCKVSARACGSKKPR